MLTKKQLAQRRAIAAKGGRALVEQYGRGRMAKIGRRGGQMDFFDMARKANARSESARRRPKQRPSRGVYTKEDAAKPSVPAGAAFCDYMA